MLPRPAELVIPADRGHGVADRQCGELFDSASKESIGLDYKSAGSQLDQGCEDHIEVAFDAGAGESTQLQ